MTEMHPIASLLAGYDVVDLSHPLHEGMPRFPTHSAFGHRLVESYWDGDAAVAYEVAMNEHTGTHVDALAHFVREGSPHHQWIDQVVATELIAPAHVIDATGLPGGDEIGLDLLARHEEINGPVEAGELVFFNTGWHRYWGSDQYVESWPGVSADLAVALASRRPVGVGTDTIGLDPSGALDYPAHHALLGTGVLVLENLAALDHVEPRCFVLAIPLPIVQGSGSPLRPLALVSRATAR